MGQHSFDHPREAWIRIDIYTYKSHLFQPISKHSFLWIALMSIVFMVTQMEVVVLGVTECNEEGDEVNES